MAEHEAIKLFNSLKIRVVWDDLQEKYFFSIVDVVGVLTDQVTPRSASTYWAVLKKRLLSEGANEMLTNCKQLKLTAADGKQRLGHSVISDKKAVDCITPQDELPFEK